MTDRRELLSLGDLKRYFEQVIDLDGLPFEPKTVLGDELPVESSELRRILARIEEVPGVRLDLAALLQVETVGDLLAVVNESGEA